MKKRLVTVIVLWVLAAAGLYGQQKAPDLVLLNGNLFTADATRPTAQALAIRGERIVAVGTTAEVSKLAGPRTRRIDLQGRLVTPGFNDAHNHFSPGPRGTNLPFKTLEPTWDEAAQALTAAVQQAPAGSWVFGRVGRAVVTNEQATRAALDQLAPNHAVLLRAHYGHGYIANSRALQQLGIGEQQADPLGGYFERTAAGQLNGRFWEYAQWPASRALAQQTPDSVAVAELRQLSTEALRLGITSVQLFSFLPFDQFIRLLGQAKLPVRVRAIPFSATTPQQRDLSEVRQLATLQKSLPTRVKASGMKWVLDGTPYERGAALRQPYLDRPGWTGKLNFSEAEVARMVQESVDLKQQLLVHCAGDRSAEVVLQALEKNGAASSWPARRVRIEHGDGLLSGDLATRAKALGVVVVQNPSHFTEPALFHQRWGTQMQPLGSLLKAGIPLALGSDGPLNPFLNIMLAGITPSNPAEALTRQQAVQAYTYGSAYAELEEQNKGRLAVGQLADVVVLSQDIFTVPPPELPRTSSLLTIIGGQVAYDAKVLK